MNQRKKPILLLGNGLLRCFSGKSASETIEILYDNQGILNSLDQHLSYQQSIDNAIKNIKTCDNSVIAKEIIYNDLINIVRPNIQIMLCFRFLFGEVLNSLDFDHILTTNYDHAIQFCINPKMRCFSYCPTNRETRNLYREYYAENEDSNPKLWHIHGDFYQPKSVIFGKDSYNHRTTHLQQNFGDLPQEKSWPRIFVDRDVYVVGLNLSQEESDIAYLISLKDQAKNGTKVYVFSGSLEVQKINYESVVYLETKKENEDHFGFYIRVFGILANINKLQKEPIQQIFSLNYREKLNRIQEYLKSKDLRDYQGEYDLIHNFFQNLLIFQKMEHHSDNDLTYLLDLFLEKTKDQEPIDLRKIIGLIRNYPQQFEQQKGIYCVDILIDQINSITNKDGEDIKPRHCRKMLNDCLLSIYSILDEILHTIKQ